MVPIRKGDGGGVVPQGFKRVRTGDGRVFYENVIPDSVIHQYTATSFNDPWPDNIASNDMELSPNVDGVSSSTFSNGETSVFFDGDDEFGKISPTGLGTSPTFSIAFTIQTTASSKTIYGKQPNSVSNANIIEITTGKHSPDGRIDFKITDDNENEITVATDNIYNDGNVHAVIIEKSGNTASDVLIYVDDMASGENTTYNDGAFSSSDFVDSVQEPYIGAFDSSGGAENFINADFGALELNTDNYGQSGRESFVSRRPEV